MSDTQRCPADAIDIEATMRFRTTYLARIPCGHSVEDVLAPEYFGQLIQQQGFQEGDKIEVEWEDFSRSGMLQVRSVEKALGLVICKQRQPISDDSGDSMEDLPRGWSMEYRGAAAKWSIACEGNTVEAGLPTPERARSRIEFLATKDARRDAVIKTAGGKAAKPKAKTEKTEEPATADA